MALQYRITPSDLWRARFYRAALAPPMALRPDGIRPSMAVLELANIVMALNRDRVTGGVLWRVRLCRTSLQLPPLKEAG